MHYLYIIYIIYVYVYIYIYNLEVEKVFLSTVGYPEATRKNRDHIV